MSGQKEYFVFISYSNTDKEWAEWLQDELEHYKLPAAFNGRNDVRDNLRDVFRDRDELSAGYDWDEQVEQALASTSNLVVVCSPSAAQSDAVNREIEIFIQQGKGNRIFPFIVSGDSPKECFPPALSHKKIGGDINKDGSCNKAFAKVVAGILGVSFDSIWQRYEQEKARKERELRTQRNNLYRMQSRLMAEKSQQMLDEGNGLRATLVLMNALPERIDDPEDKPLVAEAERMLRRAIGEKSAVIWEDVIADHFGDCINNRILLLPKGNIVLFFNIDTGDRESVELDFNGIRHVAVSPSGALFACASWREVCICDFYSRRVLYRHTCNCSNIESIVFSEDERLLLVEDIVEDRYVYDFVEDKLYSQFSVDENHVRCYKEKVATFALKEPEYYTRISGNMLKVFKSSTHECVAFTTDWFNEESVAVYNPADTSIVYQTSDCALKSLRIATGQVMTFDCRVPYIVRAVKMLPETDEMALLLHQNNVDRLEFVRLNMVRSDRFVQDLQYSRVWCCRFSSNSKFVAAVIRDSSCRYSIGFWYVEGDKPSFIAPDYTIAQSEIQMCNMVVSPDCNTVAIYYVNNTVRFYSVFDDECIEALKPHKDIVNDMVFSPCGRYFATASDDCTIKVWDAGTYSNISIIKTSTAVSHLQFDRSGEHIVGVHSNSAKLYSVKSRKCVRTFKTGTRCFKAEFSPCNRYVVSCAGSGIRVFDVSSGECIKKIVAGLKEEGFRDIITGFGFIGNGGDFLVQYEESGYYKGNIASAELEKTTGMLYYGYSNIECSSNAEYLLIGNRLLHRCKCGQIKEEVEDDWYIRQSGVLDYMEKGVLYCGAVYEDSDHKVDSCISRGNLKLVGDKRSVRVLDEELHKEVAEFYCISDDERICDADFSEDGESVIFMSETFSGKRSYQREFKPIQVLIDQARARYSQSELTDEERMQCYLD